MKKPRKSAKIIFQDNFTDHEYIFHFVKSTEFFYDKSWVADWDFSPHRITHGVMSDFTLLTSKPP